MKNVVGFPKVYGPNQNENGYSYVGHFFYKTFYLFLQRSSFFSNVDKGGA